MESALHTKTRRTAVAACGVGLLALAGCGGSNDDYQNTARPAAFIKVTAYVSDKAISVSPSSIGAGPVSLIVTNQSGRAQRVTFESGGDGAGFRQQTGPINPGAPATLTADVPPGTAVVRVDGGGIKSARIKVGKERPSAQNELLLP
ncbi:MAG: hypothetical protein JWM31_3512 [Solirubrobacterales bacterium]|nr:hypothetical protein [Solirubrobacterales bacterium]